MGVTPTVLQMLDLFSLSEILYLFVYEDEDGCDCFKKQNFVMG